MAYKWLKYGVQGVPTSLSNQALGVGWVSSAPLWFYTTAASRTLESYEIGKVQGGGVWAYRRSAGDSHNPRILLADTATNTTSGVWGNQLVTDGDLSVAGVSVGSAYRLEWRTTRVSEFVFETRMYINGEASRTDISDNRSNLNRYLGFSCGDNRAAYTLWHREMYLCDADDPILGYWEFRTVPVSALPDQKLTTAQMNGSWNANESFEQRALLDMSAVPDTNTVLGYVVEQQTYAKKTSPRLLTESSFQTELQSNQSEAQPLALLEVNQNPSTGQTLVLPVTFEQPVPAAQLNPELKLKYIHVPEE